MGNQYTIFTVFPCLSGDNMIPFLILVGVLTTVSAFPASVKRELDTVPELIIDKYVGKWYQVFGNRNNWSRYPAFSVCIAPQYAVANDTALRLLNSGRLFIPDGEVFYLRGHVLRTEEPGKLKVQFRDFTRQG